MTTKKATDLNNQQNGSVAIFLLDTITVCVTLLLVYTVTYSGSFRVDDEHILAARAQSLAFWEDINYPQVFGNDRVRHLSTIVEEKASPVVAIEPGQAVLGSILYRIAAVVDVGGAQSYFLLNLFGTALSGAMVYLSVRVFGYQRRVGIIVALLYGFATMAWPFSKTAFRDPLAALLTSLAILGWTIYIKKYGKIRTYGLITFILGTIGALFFKSNVLVLLPAFLISSIVLGYRHHARPRVDSGWVLIGLLPIILLTILTLTASNPGPLSRFSITYYLEMAARYLEIFNSQTILAFVGPFFSPAKNIFLFNPIFIIIPWVAYRYWDKMKQIILPAMVSILLLSLFQALHLRELWGGSLIWGMRFYLPVLPLLAILLAPWVDWLLTKGSKWTKNLGWTLVVVSILVQIAGAVVDWSVPFEQWYRKGLDPVSLDAYWQIEFLVIPIHLRQLFSISSWDLGWLRTSMEQPIVGMIPLISFSILLVVFILHRRVQRLADNMRTARIALICLLVLALILPFYPALWLLRTDPGVGGGSPEIARAIAWARSEAEAGDLVIVDSYGTDLWKQMMSQWDAPIPWYSLPYEFPSEVGQESPDGQLHAATLELFAQLGDDYSRLIYMTSDHSPDYRLHNEEQWLLSSTTFLSKREYSGRKKVEVSIYLP